MRNNSSMSTCYHDKGGVQLFALQSATGSAPLCLPQNTSYYFNSCQLSLTLWELIINH